MHQRSLGDIIITFEYELNQMWYGVSILGFSVGVAAVKDITLITFPAVSVFIDHTSLNYIVKFLPVMTLRRMSWIRSSAPAGKRCFTCCCRYTNLLWVYWTRQNWRNAGRFQRISSDWAGGPRWWCCSCGWIFTFGWCRLGHWCHLGCRWWSHGGAQPVKNKQQLIDFKNG